MKYKILDKEFRTKEEIKEYVRNILIKNFGTIQPGSYEFKFMKELFKRHPNYEEKCLEHTITMQTRRGLGGAIDLVLGIWTDFGNGMGVLEYDTVSYNKCITGRDHTAHQKKMIRLRRSINNQIEKFRSTVNHINECQICGGGFNGKPHVDHVIPFSKIVLLFGCSAEEDFKIFHKRIATYQLLCEKCNIEKSDS
jgi:hypothetical protein